MGSLQTVSEWVFFLISSFLNIDFISIQNWQNFLLFWSQIVTHFLTKKYPTTAHATVPCNYRHSIIVVMWVSGLWTWLLQPRLKKEMFFRTEPGVVATINFVSHIGLLIYMTKRDNNLKWWQDNKANPTKQSFELTYRPSCTHQNVQNDFSKSPQETTSLNFSSIRHQKKCGIY